MSSQPDGNAGQAPGQAGTDGTYSVDARGGMGVQIGEGNTQIIYTYNRLTWTDGVAPPPLASVSGVVDSPYRGLSAFEEQDAAFFFGREAATTQVLVRMSRLRAGAGLLVVSGVSGAGKSSLLRAGVLPRIRGAGLASAPEAARWPCLVLTPTRAPLDELALRVAVLAGADAAAVRRGLDSNPEGFALIVRQAALTPPPGPIGSPEDPVAGRTPQPERRLLLVIDQFEQIFTQCPDDRQRQAFITALHAAASTRQGPDHTAAALVVIGVRADFEARCANYPQLAGAVQDRYLVTGMTGRQLRLAITEPAKAAGSRVDDDLVEMLLAEMHAAQSGTASTGILPLLSHALDQAWRSRAGQALTPADYERTGGIEGAVADSARRAYERLTPARRAAARQVFTRLTAISTEGIDTADRATRAELTEGKTAAEVRDVDAVLEAFAAERLLILAADSVEISHEILLTAWPLLRDTWLAETHADRIVRTRLHNMGTEWTRHSRDPSYLYGGSLLQAASETAARITADPVRHPPLSSTERDFLQASDRAYRRTARRRRVVIAGLLALTLTATTAAGIAVHNAANAARQHAVALSRLLDAESLAIAPAKPVIARRLAVAAWRVSGTAQASAVITQLLTEQQQKGILPADPSTVGGVAFSRDGKLLASAGGDGTVRLWNPATGQPAGPPLNAASNQNGVFGVAFSRDGKLLASAGGDGTVRLWDPATGRAAGPPLQTGSGSQGGVLGVAFSPDGKLLAGAGADGTVRRWNPATGQRVGAPLSATGAQGVAFSPDGKLLASAAEDGTVPRWNPATGRAAGPPLQTGSGSQGGVLGVAFSPDGKLLATAGADGAVRRWNPATGQPAGAPLSAAGAHDGVRGVAFSPDGKLLASAGADGTVRLWNPATGQTAGLPAGTPLHATDAHAAVRGVAFSRDGKLLATAGADGTVRRWNPATGQPAGPLHHATGDQTAVTGVAFSPDGKLLATAGGDGTVRRWDPATGQPAGAPLQATDAHAAVSGVAFSRDGKLLASAGGDGTVRRWNPATGQPVGAPLQTGSGSHAVFGVAFSPDGKLLASARADGTVRLWNPATGQAVGAALKTGSSAKDGVLGVAFSPDGRLLASAGGDGTVRLWDPATGQPVGAPLQAAGGQAFVMGVAFSPDGKLLASAGGDGTVRLWDPATGQAVGAPLQTGSSSQGGVSGVAFSPDGKLLASADDDGTVRLWEVSLFAQGYAALCVAVGPPTGQDWEQYAPGEPRLKVCA